MWRKCKKLQRNLRYLTVILKKEKSRIKKKNLKRKAAEETEECESKKVKVIPLVKGKVAPEMMYEDITVEEEEEGDYESKIK